MRDLTEEKLALPADPRLPGLVHDLNNVFQALVEVAGILSAEARSEFLAEAILRSVERGKNLTAGLQALEGTGAPFERIVNDAVQFVKDACIGGGPRIHFVPEIEPGIELRRNWAWERVLINLLSNSVRELAGGGTIEIFARRLKRSTRDERIEIIVRDDGPGIPPEILTGIFKPYVSTRGSGLGLHIVQTIVKQDGGQVRAANRTDRSGAEFTITIPVGMPRRKPADADGSRKRESRTKPLKAHASGR